MTDSASEALVLHAEVLTASLTRRAAERELEQFGITASPADISAWLSATGRQRREWALQWATYVANGEPAWKARRA